MPVILAIFGVFAGGALLGAQRLDGVQRNITTHLIDGRRIKVLFP